MKVKNKLTQEETITAKETMLQATNPIKVWLIEGWYYTEYRFNELFEVL